VPVAIGSLLIVLVALAGIIVLLTRTRMVPVSGSVRCSSGQPVQGVWVQAEVDGKGAFAAWRYDDADQRVATFTHEVRGPSYAVHVGCGGSPHVWLVDVWSEYVTGGPYVFVCHDVQTRALYKRCVVTP
jgi:hypothetical protein